MLSSAGIMALTGFKPGRLLSLEREAIIAEKDMRVNIFFRVFGIIFIL